MSSFEEDQATIAEAMRRQKNRGNPWKGERGEAMLENGTGLKATPIEWHWNGWLARGKLHLLAGSKTTGKSTVSLNLMATTTISADWPDGTRAPFGDVLLWTGEDGIEETILPRFLAAGGDRKRLHIIRKMRLPDGSTIPFDPTLTWRH
jgi:putative DNA primase/helicase